MELFIESPRRARQCAERERCARVAQRADATACLDLDEPHTDFGVCPSYAADAYRAEVAYDKRRTAHRKLGHALRLLALIVAIPAALIAVFTASYALTFILNGAGPDEVLAALQELWVRIEDVLAGVLAE